MKKFLFAGVAALILTGVTQQQAAAWIKFSLGASFHTSFSCGGTGFSFHCWDKPAPPCWPESYFPGPVWDPSGHVVWPGYAASHGQPVHAQVQTNPSAGHAGSGYLNPGYYQPVGYYYQAPSYWYGR